VQQISLAKAFVLSILAFMLQRSKSTPGLLHPSGLLRKVSGFHLFSF
jgi:hypothetical protein